MEKEFADNVAIVRAEKDNKVALEKLKKKELASLTTPYFRHMISFDPRTLWIKVSCPVLALNGDRDIQVSADKNLEAIKNALQYGGDKDVTVIKLPGLNHLFQTCKTGMPGEYATIEETIAPQVLDIIANWILKQTS
jgi:pimeloyl-ACP methyl ester carboxylesterase